MAGTFRTALKLTGLAILLVVCLQLHIVINKPWYRYKLMRVQMLIILQTVISYGSYYLYRTYKPSPSWKKLIALIILLTHFSFFAQFMFISDNPSFISLIPFLATSCHIFLCLGTLCGDIGTFLFIPFTLKISVGYQKFKMNSVPICAIILTVWSFINTILPPQHSTVHVPISGLDSKFDKFHIMHLSDIHVGPTTGKVFVDWLVTEVNTYNPNMVVITGDLVDSSVKNLRNAVWNLKNLNSKYGTFYVTGNHEYYTNDVDNWLNYLRDQLGLTTLHNQHHVIRDGNASLCVTGIDDPQAEKMSYPDHSPDPVGAAEGCPSDTPIVMLAHQPKAAKLSIKKLPRVDLVLSGHTHGGQFFPVHIPVYLANPYFAGLYKVTPDTHVYVSRGLRFYGAPTRLFSYPEFTSVYLHVKQD